jgi:hypothetical protein
MEKSDQSNWTHHLPNEMSFNLIFIAPVYECWPFQSPSLASSERGRTRSWQLRRASGLHARMGEEEEDPKGHAREKVREREKTLPPPLQPSDAFFRTAV